jgi:hypothetical protein
MKLAVIFSVPSTTSSGFEWRWRSADHKHESANSFFFYRDCVTDAERNGYKVELGRIEKNTTGRGNAGTRV